MSSDLNDLLDQKKLESLSHYIDMLLDAICIVDKDGHFLFLSAGAERIFGYTREELLGKQMLDMVHPDDREATLHVVDDIMKGQETTDFENRYIRKDGQVVYLLWSAKWASNEEFRIAVARDISRSKRSEAIQSATYAISEAAHHEESLSALYKRIHQIMQTLLPISDFVIALYDEPTQNLTFAYSSIYVDQESLHAHLSENLTSWIDSKKVCFDIENGWIKVPLCSAEKVIGSLIVKVGAEHINNEDSQNLLEYISTQIAAAITRKQLHDRLRFLAMYDHLTGLANRELFHDRIQHAISRALRQQTELALFYLDLDDFKQANDNFGHDVGDALLQQAAERIQSCVRSTDTVARFGGDEFVVLLETINHQQDAKNIADKIRQAMAKVFVVGNCEIYLSTSIGIALLPAHGNIEKILLQHADKAMYEAKRLGGNQYII
ncbi:GGDEF domain-containing protein [Methylophaga sulfidovorans]|uniref:PAS domain S-box-containing protein/diguanylate cyclase (GGDEF) domain-containing protein n=1 Tax=Methylophaga sulfidovorans TaxID=45496 RepID=A0A1I3ZGX7_9GAMM|nr:GGDEF domain-containing protein [Methylophaga sulfidovorans]SFK43378.1 PAS domain S-box-containing protein/diguanylate cyclase (GGDEF) domain-containing protein [Methylophaga sulfidovorans]